MIILDKPFASDELKKYLQDSKVPVLKNAFSKEAKKDFDLNLKDGAEFKKLLKTNKNLLTISENSLKWIYDNSDDNALIRGISAMKNKTEVREILSSVYPDFFFMEAPAGELKNINFSELKVPLVLKPSVGFFSVGVYVISDAQSWDKAVNDIEKNIGEWENDYPEDVVGKAKFILEEYIEGEEYALDAYYDGSGKAVILNIMKHEFGSESDVSDRLYYSGKEIIELNLRAFTDFLDDVNEFFKVRNFPLHVELRVKNGKILPIEFNPMRFAGWCTTDLSFFAYGLRTYDYFFNNKKPDWKNLLKGKDGKIYSLILLDKPPSYSYKPQQRFDYDMLKKKFKKILSLRKTEYAKAPVFGFLFTETDISDRSEFDYIIKADLTEFLRNF